LEVFGKAGHAWDGMRQEVTQWINECGICQKCKHYRVKHPTWEDEAEHHLYSGEPLSSLSMDTVGPLPEDELGNRYIMVIMDNFSKFVGLYPTKSTTAKECAQSFLQWIGVFGVPKEIRSDGGSQFQNQLMTHLSSLLNYHHTIVVAYHPEGNGMVERRMKEIMKHLRALVFENRIKDVWSQFLPLVQRIINYSIDGSIGTQPARVLLGDIAESDLAMEVPKNEVDQSIPEYLVRLREMQAILIKATQDYLRNNQRKRGRDPHHSPPEGPGFREGQFVLLKYPNRPPNKLAGLYRGPMIRVGIDRPDLIKVRDLISNQISLVHVSRLRPFRHPTDMTIEEAMNLAAVDLDEFHVEKIVTHSGGGKDPKKWTFRVRWVGYEEGDDTWLPWSAVKDLEALDVYSQAYPELNLG
jgi:hypothetical protein